MILRSGTHSTASTRAKLILAFAVLAAASGCRPNFATRGHAGAQERPNLCRGQESPLPAPTGHVNDFAEVIDGKTREELESKLARLKADSGIEFAVVTVETTGGRDIFDYSLDVACGWGVGSDGGGLLLLVAIKDRRWRIQVSRRLEADLPDAAVKEIGDRMAPLFRRGKYAEGIARCVDEHVARLAERRRIPRGEPKP